MKRKTQRDGLHLIFFSLVISMENRLVFYVRYINIMLPALRQIHFNCFKGSASFYEHCKINSLQNIMLKYFILHCYFFFLHAPILALLCFTLFMNSLIIIAPVVMLLCESKYCKYQMVG